LFTILHTGLGGSLSSIEQKLQGTELQLVQLNEDTQLVDAEVFLIGPYQPNPVKLVQQIAEEDRHLSIIVLALPADFLKVKQSIQFAPFVGKNTVCFSYAEGIDLLSAIQNAALRTKQRRSFSRINKTHAPLSSIASSTVKVQDFGIFLESAPIPSFLIDEESRVVALNKKAKELFHTEEQKVYELKDFFPSLSLQQLRLSIAIDTDTAIKVIEVNDMVLELYLSQVINDGGKSLNILLVSDITERSRKENELIESEALFRFMADAMPQKLWTADQTGYRNFFNQKWVEFTGLNVSELEGWRWTQAIHPDDRVRNVEQWRRSVKTGEDFQFQHRIRRKDGEYRWHLVRGVARKDRNGKVLMWVGTNTDIHDQKAFAEELERRVKERTFELEKSNSELEQFVYVTSHDLQEPLRKIRLFSDMLKTASDTLDESSQRFVDKISATALRMTTLLKELLNFTQMSKQEQLEPTDLNAIVEGALLDLELKVIEKQAIVNVGQLPTINAIPVQMHQLFYNLLNNALKFTRAGVSPVIDISSKTAKDEALARHSFLIQDKDYCHITVQDNGIGFDQQYSEQIFHIFQRLHNRTEYSGTGIGLALCKKVITNHYGAIYAESVKGEGAAFHILLPVE
jgi:PAS domain S-box-containing protein